MNTDLIEIGVAIPHYNVSGTKILKYSLEVFHKGLNEHKIISGPEVDILETKLNLIALKWRQKWLSLEEKRLQKEAHAANVEEAERLTIDAQKAINEIEHLLQHTLNVNDAINWDGLKLHNTFEEPNPENFLDEKIQDIKKPFFIEKYNYPRQPSKRDIKYSLELSFIESIIPSKKVAKKKQVDDLYEADKMKWKEACQRIDAENKKAKEKYEQELLEYDKKIEAVKHENSLEIDQWEKRKIDFYRKQDVYNSKIDQLREKYCNLDVVSVLEYNEMVLSNSKYPDTFPQNLNIEYVSETKILVVDFQLPSLEDIPKVKEVKFIASRKTLKESYISKSELNSMYDSAIYKIALRTVHELFEADIANALKSVTFNGWVKIINKANGKTENKYIISIQASKKEFLEIDLANVDPKLCFQSLKGISASKLSSFTPVKPILQISTFDKRFIASYDVADSLDDTTNLAIMDWEDFEHLIRELFEKEFSDNGGEVKVTQASRDGGVDAIAFDPDPIRGGKIVIQAKRYTNIVGVSAVRDLYGTILNEGATKGILVTTSNYGSDTYEFAKGKPISLLNGSNLLHLLEKHGHKAKIDINEAKAQQ